MSSPDNTETTLVDDQWTTEPSSDDDRSEVFRASSPSERSESPDVEYRADDEDEGFQVSDDERSEVPSGDSYGYEDRVIFSYTFPNDRGDSRANVSD